MKKIFLLLSLSTILLPSLLFASENSNCHRGFRNPEVKQYVSQHIMPVLNEKRLVLENELSPTEKTEIADCRSALASLRSQEHKLRQQLHQEKSDYSSPENKQAFANFHKQHMEIMQRLQKVADMHSTTLSAIRSQLEPLHKEWSDGLAQIKTANGKERANEYAPGIPGYSLSGHHAAAFFLLMQVPSQASALGDLKSDPISSANSNNTVSLNAFSIWPNPASTEIVTGNDPLPASNEFFLYDVQGKKVMALENIQSAQHLDVSQIPSGSYVIQLRSGEQTASRQIVISH